MVFMLIFAFLKLVKSRIRLRYIKWQVWWLHHHRERGNHHRKILEKIVLYPKDQSSEPKES